MGYTKYDHPYDDIDFSKVYVASESDSVEHINFMIGMGHSLVLQPGIYVLSDSIKITNDNQVILGLGYATLVSQTGAPCITVGNVQGVKISGVLLQAGPADRKSVV